MNGHESKKMEFESMRPTTAKFSKALLEHFRAESGAFSLVTEVEASKRQVVTRVVERDLLENFFGEQLTKRLGKGGKKSLEKLNETPNSYFRIYPSGVYVSLPLVYPKLNKRELRIYFNQGQFSPNAGDYWYTFIRNDEIWIGSFSANFLDLLENGAMIPPASKRDENLEPEVDSFQDIVNSKPSKQISTTSLVWQRDPKVTRKALKQSAFKCEIFPDMPFFISRASGNPYMEAHHFIPIKHQAHYEQSLDTIENICILNPYAHRMLHHAKYKEIKPYVLDLALRREGFLSSIGLKPEDALEYYS